VSRGKIPLASVAALIENALALASKTIPSTSMFALIETPDLFETLKVAVSAGPLGTVAGVQLPGVFQLPFCGFNCQVALPACPPAGASTSNNADKTPTRSVEWKWHPLTPDSGY